MADPVILADAGTGTDLLAVIRPCPECNGPRLVSHPSGMTFRHGPACTLGVAEDATMAADFDRMFNPAPYLCLPDLPPARFDRVPTVAELTLLAASGVAVMPDTVTVSSLSTAVRRRDFDGVTLDEPKPEPPWWLLGPLPWGTP